MCTRIIRVQLLVTVGVSVAALALGASSAGSALLGGLISLVPTAYFIYRVFRRDQAGSPEQELGNMYRAEVGKLAMAALMLVAVFAVAENLDVVALLLAFIVVQVSGSAASLTLGSTGPSRGNASRGSC